MSGPGDGSARETASGAQPHAAERFFRAVREGDLEGAGMLLGVDPRLVDAKTMGKQQPRLPARGLDAGGLQTAGGAVHALTDTRHGHSSSARRAARSAAMSASKTSSSSSPFMILSSL